MPIKEPPEVRFTRFVKVNMETGCHEWTGAINKKGYPTFWDGERKRLAYVYAWEVVHGEKPKSTTFDHVCRVRHCVNEKHVEPVPHVVNLSRGKTNGTKSHCPQGHAYTIENTYLYPKKNEWPNRHRACRACRRQHMKAYRLKTKESL